MKAFLIATVLSCSLFAANTFAQQRDTTFLVKDTLNTIFIDPDPYSSNYDSIANSKRYPYGLNPLLSSSKWVILHAYQSKYYLYAPCDWMYNFTVEIAKKHVDFSGAELSRQKIRSSKLSAGGNLTVDFKRKPFSRKRVVVYPIDREKGIAVFEITGMDDRITYQLMVDATKVKDYPIIVNGCTNEKRPEFLFDEIDYQDLLKRKKG